MPRALPLPTWDAVQSAIISCNRCPRLRDHCNAIAQIKRAAYLHDTYWARPIPNLGTPDARLLILGLAPAAHGANRTGRMFTGDRSGDFLFAAMHAEGFANQPTSVHSTDGLQLIDCLITAAAHCAPPGNKPDPIELANCQHHLDRTLAAMPAFSQNRTRSVSEEPLGASQGPKSSLPQNRTRSVSDGAAGILVLGKIAFDAALALYKRRNWLDPQQKSPRPKFAHAALHKFPNAPFLLCSYHPSQQNTFTKKLTQPMLRQIFHTARKELSKPASPVSHLTT